MWLGILHVRWMNALKMAYIPKMRRQVYQESPIMAILERKKRDLDEVAQVSRLPKAACYPKPPTTPKCSKCGSPLEYAKDLGHTWVSCSNPKCQTPEAKANEKETTPCQPKESAATTNQSEAEPTTGSRPST